ncbi:MAG: SulP family inorganic anion transporter [Pseudomonadota bacterium]
MKLESIKPVKLPRRLQWVFHVFPFLGWMHLINERSLKADIQAGLTGAVIVLPQGVAFATIAGMPPEYGLYTAMITPIVAALFGSSLHLISGPTTAISIVVFSSVSNYATPGSPEFVSTALTLTFLAGLYQLAFGLAKLGRIVNFVSHTVVTGFTAGAAILIATSQMKHVLGLEVERGGSFLFTWTELYRQLGDTNLYVLTVSGVTLFAAIAFKWLFPRLPNLLFAMIVGSLVCVWIDGANHGVALVGEIPRHLPPFSSPDFSLETIRILAPEAFAIALLGLIEAVSIARSIATKSHQRLDSNQEFIGQGLSNLAGSFFSSYAGSGSFTRTGVNYTAGAKTPLSAIVSAVSLMLIVLLVAPLTAFLPIPAMGGVILLVAYNLIDTHHIKKVLRISTTETAILSVTFFATLFLELEFAIYMGVLLSLIIFLMRTSTPEIVDMAPDPSSDTHRMANVHRNQLRQCPQLKVISVNMSIYFGSQNHIQKRLNKITDKQGYKHILVLCQGVNFVDMAGAEMIVEEAERLREMGGGLYLCGIKYNVSDYLNRSRFGNEFGLENIFDKKSEAIEELTKRLNHNMCATCTARIFTECAGLPNETEALPTNSRRMEPMMGLPRD